MSKTVYRFQFEDDVPLEEAETSLVLAIIAAEALHGQPAVRLSLRYLFSEEKRACAVTADNEVAHQVVLIFIQFLLRQFDDDAFQVTQPLSERPAPPAGEDNGKRARPARSGNGSCGTCAACGKEVGA